MSAPNYTFWLGEDGEPRASCEYPNLFTTREGWDCWCGRPGPVHTTFWAKEVARLGAREWTEADKDAIASMFAGPR